MTPTELVKQIDDHQRKYPTRYFTGATMSYKQFRRMANFITPGLNKLDPSVTADIVQFINTQAKINRILAHKGLKLKSRNYYTEWYIAEDSNREVARMNRKAITLVNAANRLHTGIKRNKSNPLARLTASVITETAKYLHARLF